MPNQDRINLIHAEAGVGPIGSNIDFGVAAQGAHAALLDMPQAGDKLPVLVKKMEALSEVVMKLETIDCRTHRLQADVNEGKVAGGSGEEQHDRRGAASVRCLLEWQALSSC